MNELGEILTDLAFASDGIEDGALESTCQRIIAWAESENAPLIELISDFYDDDECSYDHHGYCQAHGWFTTRTVCPNKRANEALQRRKLSDTSKGAV